MNTINALIGAISRLEDKRDNGSITMDEVSQLDSMIYMCEKLITK